MTGPGATTSMPPGHMEKRMRRTWPAHAWPAAMGNSADVAGPGMPGGRAGAVRQARRAQLCAPALALSPGA